MNQLNPFQKLQEQGVSGLVAFLTLQTCGEACWTAREDICRCSCGGKNHGCLRTADGVQPQRMAKIDGIRYKLVGVSDQGELHKQACEINRQAGYSSVQPATKCTDHEGKVWYNQYHYTWRTTDKGAPARLKNATKQQIAAWAELTAYRGKSEFELYRNPIQLLWVREEMPPKPKILMVDKHTGEPLENQLPDHCW